MKKYEVTAAILMNEGEILCAQRGKENFPYLSYKFEFPGGKVEPGETREQALERELFEELQVELKVDPANHFLTIEHTYPDFYIRMHSYLCPISHRQVTLKEHHDFKWLSVDELETLDWAMADVPIVEKLRGSF